jgi:type IV pilus assembly protein PilA
MLQRLQRRLQGEREGGFTLIELMVVVLIIAILIAIAIPTFLGARQRAQDRAAQSNLRNALTAEKTYYTDKQAYTAATASVKSIEPSLTFSAAAAAAQGTVSVVVTSTSGTLNDIVTLGTKSASGTCFYIKDVASGATAGTYYGNDTTCTTVATAATSAKW